MLAKGIAEPFLNINPVASASLALADGVTTSVYNAANQLLTATALLGITTYSYDLAGNRRTVETPSGDVTTYTFDALNHNTHVELPDGEEVACKWAPVNKASDDRQIERDDGVEVRRYVWDDQAILQEVDGTNTVLAQNTVVPGDYGQLLSRTEAGVTSTYQFDALGSTRLLTDTSGTITDEYGYEAFGELSRSTGSTENPFQWIGQQGYRQEAATGEYNLRARDYDPAAARFTSNDPLGLSAGDSNFYRYVSNDPVNGSDPSGLEEPLQPGSINDIGNLPNRPIAICNAETELLDAVGVNELEELLHPPAEKIRPYWIQAVNKEETCSLGNHRRIGRIEIETDSGTIKLFVLFEFKSTLLDWRGSSYYTIIGIDNGTKPLKELCSDFIVREEAEGLERALHAVPWGETCDRASQGKVPHLGNVLLDGASLLGGLGAAFKNAKLAQIAVGSAAAGTSINASGHAWDGEYSAAATDLLAGLLIIWGVKSAKSSLKRGGVGTANNGTKLGPKSCVTPPVPQPMPAASPAKGGAPNNSIDSNKLNHVFGKPQHELEPLLNQFGGNQQAAYQAVQNAAQAAAQEQGITGVFNNLTINVGGLNITVRGNVINGVVNIGTFFQ